MILQSVPIDKLEVGQTYLYEEAMFHGRVKILSVSSDVAGALELGVYWQAEVEVVDGDSIEPGKQFTIGTRAKYGPPTKGLYLDDGSAPWR